MAVNLNDRSWHDAGDFVRVGSLLVQGTLIQNSAGPIPGPGVFTTPPFIYTAVGNENPNGFVMTFPSGVRAGGNTNYAPIVQYHSGAADFMMCAAPPAGYAAGQMTVKTSGQLQAGDKLAVIIGDR